jgi:hypothetical protein
MNLVAQSRSLDCIVLAAQARRTPSVAALFAIQGRAIPHYRTSLWYRMSLLPVRLD